MATSTRYDEIEEYLVCWGQAKRKINRATYPRSIFGRIAEEGAVGAAIRGRPPDPPEVLLGNALIVARALQICLQRGILREIHKDVLDIHYIGYGRSKDKADRLRITPNYYHKIKWLAKTALKPWILRCKTYQDKGEEYQPLTVTAKNKS